MLLVKIKHFVKNYRVPMIGTALFIVIVLAVILIRTYQRSVLAEVLPRKPNPGQDYAALLSNDKTDKFNKKNVNDSSSMTTTYAVATGSNTDAGGLTTFTDTTISPETGSGTSSGTVPNAGPSPSPTTSPTSPPGFMAVVSKLGKDVKPDTINCPTTSNQCTKTMYFKGEVTTSNGPGTFYIRWTRYKKDVGDPHSADPVDPYSAPSASATVPIPKKFDVSCSPNKSYILVIELSVTTPTPNTKSMEYPFTCS